MWSVDSEMSFRRGEFHLIGSHSVTVMNRFNN